MFFLVFLSLTFACLVHADFYIFEAASGFFTAASFHSLPEPGCQNLDYADWWIYQSDVSGDKKGCRIVRGSDTGAAPDVLECNTDFGHFSKLFRATQHIDSAKFKLTSTAVYKNRNWGVFDLDDKQHGTCQPYTDYKFDCNRLSIYRRKGHSLFNCSTDIGTS